MRLEPLMNLHADLEPPAGIGAGVCQIYDVKGGTFEGDRLRGQRYAWLNRVVAIAQGRALPNAVEYRIYAAANG